MYCAIQRNDLKLGTAKSLLPDGKEYLCQYSIVVFVRLPEAELLLQLVLLWYSLADHTAAFCWLHED